MELLDTVFRWLMALGPKGLFTVFVGCLLVIVIFKAGTAALNLFTAMLRWWRALPLPGKQLVVAVGAYVAYKTIWPNIPKTTVFGALGLGLLTVYWLGAMHLARRYAIDMDWHGWNVWTHHLQTSAMQRGLTEALGNATGKKEGRSRRPTITADGVRAVYEPPDGMSAQELCDAINDGTLEPSLARRIGWKQVNGTIAQVDGNVVVIYVAASRSDGYDPLSKSTPWPGVEGTWEDD